MAPPTVALPRTFVAWLWPYLEVFSGRTRATVAALAMGAVLAVLWYPKPAPTFADALARLRRQLWFEQLVTSLENTDITKTPPPLLRRLVDLACYAP